MKVKTLVILFFGSLLLASCGDNNRTASLNSAIGPQANALMAGNATASQRLQFLLQRVPCNVPGNPGFNRVPITVQPGPNAYFQQTPPFAQQFPQQGPGAMGLDIQNGQIFFGINSQGHVVVAKSAGQGMTQVQLHYCVSANAVPAMARILSRPFYNVSLACGGIGEISQMHIGVQHNQVTAYPVNFIVAPLQYHPQASAICQGGITP